MISSKNRLLTGFKSFVINFVLILLVCNLSIGQEKSFKFKHLSLQDGLSQSSVTSIAQDSFGNIWVGTRDGLNKYDGTKFTIFRNDPSVKTTISNNDILSIEIDQSGNIWIGTHYGLNMYDPTRNTFKNFLQNRKENSLSNNTVEVVKELSNGEIWIGTSEGLSIYNKDTGKFVNVYHDKNNLHSISGDHIMSILETDNGTIWIGTSVGLSKLVNRNKNNFSFKNFSLDKVFRKREEVSDYQDIIQGFDNNQLLIATRTDGVLQFNITEETFTPFFSKNQQKLINKDVRRLSIDANGLLWVGTYFGLNIVTKDFKIRKFLNEPNEPDSLSKNSIKCFFTDKKGSIWIGTYYGGINIWDDSNINYINYNQNIGKTGLNYGVVSSIEYDGNNQLFFGTEGGGINSLNIKRNEISYINKTNFKSLPDNNIKTLELSNEKDLWIGTYKAGVAIFNIKSNKFENDKISAELKKYISNAPIFTIEDEGNQFIWLGTWGKGLIRYDKKSKKHIIFKQTKQEENTLTNNFCRSILKDSNEDLWIGTKSGLNFISKNKVVKHFFYDNEMHFGDDILCVFEDNKKRIWVGTRSKGLFKFNGIDFDAINLANKRKKITTIHSILEDENKLWISSNQGLINFDTYSNESVLYDREDGLISNEFNNNSSLKVGESTFYFGGPYGVTSFNSKNVISNMYSPQVLITDFKINDKSLEITESQPILSKTIPYTRAITLPYHKGNFSIEFAIPNFINPNSNQYQYRMLGLEDNWIITDQTQAHYTIQKPGQYVFEVKGANNDGVWNTSSTRLEIKVKPAFWLSPVAKLIYFILFFVTLLWLGNIFRSRTKLKHKLELEHLNNIRKEEINNAKLQFFTDISHEFRTPLTLITGPLKQILTDYKGSSVVYKKLMVIESNAKHLLQLINRLMDFRKLQHNSLKLETAEGNIVKFLKEIFLSFKELAKSGNYDYDFYSDNHEIFIYYDRPKLEQVFYNLISNAFKYTPKGGKISVVIKKVSNTLIVCILDSGPGISKEYKGKIFDRFFEIPKDKSSKNLSHTGTGIGLSIVKRIINLHKGTISVKDNTNTGSIFEVTLLLGKDHLNEDEIIKDFKFSDDIDLYAPTKNYLTQLKPNKTNELLLDHKKDSILLVEDNIPLRNFIKDLLKKNYNVIEANNGEEGYKKAIHYLPSIIVSDVIMPVMVGTELCSKIKENIKTSHIPLILLTSRTSLLYKFEGLESGADDYIQKPFDIREFQLRVKNLIESSKRLRNKFSEEENFTPNEIVVTSVDEKLLKKALKIVENNINNDQFDIPRFCRELGVSRTLLFTKIKAWTNYTPNEFIQEIRMKRAAQLLEKNKLNISQICHNVGFKNPKYFSKCFRKKFGVSPTEYIKKFSEDFLD